MKQREPMNTNEVRINDATSDASGKVDMRLEVDIIPVSSVDRSKQFYESLGWRLDDDVAPLDGLRIVQFTPPGVGDTVDDSDAFAQQQLGGFRDRRAGPQRAD